MRRIASPAHIALALVVAGGLAVRLYGLGHGLPFSFHSDESLHFTSRAVAMIEGGTLDPDYFQNPSGFTYLVYLVLRLGGFGDVAAEFNGDPTDIYLSARAVAVALAMLGVLGAYAVGRRLWGQMEGVAAAAILAFAFLPVAYSRYAVTDVGAFLPVLVAIFAVIRMSEEGGRRWFLVAGTAIGFALGFKYTTGLLLAPLLVAAAIRLRDGRKETLVNTALALAAMTAAFLVTTPYFLIDLGQALDELRAQSYAADEPKLGQGPESPFAFYPATLTWALGWGAAIAALAGLVWQWRRDRTRAVLLALFPLLLYLYLCTAERHFARWLMPTYPVLALLAGFALARTARSLSLKPTRQALALGVLLVAVLAQPLLADLRTGKLMRRDDTRTLAREFLTGPGFRDRMRLVIEPSTPRAWYRGFVAGFGPPPRYRKGYPPLPARPTRYLYAAGPERIERYREAGFCHVVVFSFVRDRAEQEDLERALAYYRALERDAEVVFSADPYDEGESVPFDFDRSTHLYYDRGFERTGPEVTVYRLPDCKQGHGRPTTGDPAAYWR